MRLGTLSLIALLGTTTVATAYDPYPFQRSDGKWGYVDDDHCWVIEPIFDRSSSFREGTAHVEIGDVDYIINKNGTLVYKSQFRRMQGFFEGFAAFEISLGKWGFLDSGWSVVVNPIFEDVMPFSEGLAPVSVDGKWGYIDRSGKMVISPQFDFGSMFSEGLALVSLADRWGFISSSGQFAVNPVYYMGSHGFSDGLAAVRMNGGKFGYIDASGKTVIEASFDGANSFSEGFAAVKVGEYWGFIDHAGRMVIEPKFEQAPYSSPWMEFREGLSVAFSKGKWGYVASDGTFSIPAEFDDAAPFSHGRASVRIGDRWFTIDRLGRILLDPTCDHTR